ncbi:MAG TPA: hypothetical protein VNR90_13840 [Vicinamibacterales bacterium]|jgi:hypothetical protein|nr:hypothetical protein [Vicinamibacterales bacterium]
MIRGSRALVALALVSLPGIAFAQAQPAPSQTPPAAGAASATAGDDQALDVTVTYSGKGEVSAKHEISIFLFTDPNITEASMPVAVGVLEENGGHFQFKNLPPTVYIAVVYDDTGNYTREGPPPPGTPVMLYGMASGAAEAVKPGKDAKVTVTFDDSNRM